MEIGIDLLDEGEIEGQGIVIQILDVEREAVVSGESAEEALEFIAQDLAFCGVLQDVAHGRIEFAIVRIDVVEVGKNFGIFFGLLNGALYLVVFIGIVGYAVLEDREFEAVLGGALKFDGGGVDVKPLREEQVYLLNVLLQG